MQSDVSSLADLDRLFATVRDDAGTIDILFANAGGGTFAPLGSITEEHFDTIFATNVKGTLFTVQKALPLMKDGGSIILTGSTHRDDRHPCLQRLQRQQGGDPQLRPKLDSGSRAAEDTGQCPRPRRNLHAGLVCPCTNRGRASGDGRTLGRDHSAWTDG